MNGPRPVGSGARKDARERFEPERTVNDALARHRGEALHRLLRSSG